MRLSQHPVYVIFCILKQTRTCRGSIQLGIQITALLKDGWNYFLFVIVNSRKHVIHVRCSKEKRKHNRKSECRHACAFVWVSVSARRRMYIFSSFVRETLFKINVAVCQFRTLQKSDLSRILRQLDKIVIFHEYWDKLDKMQIVVCIHTIHVSIGNEAS